MGAGLCVPCSLQGAPVNNEHGIWRHRPISGMWVVGCSVGEGRNRILGRNEMRETNSRKRL